MKLDEILHEGRVLTVRIEVVDTKQAVEWINYCLGEKKDKLLLGSKVQAVDFLSDERGKAAQQLYRDMTNLLAVYRKNLSNEVGNVPTREQTEALFKGLRLDEAVLTDATDQAVASWGPSNPLLPHLSAISYGLQLIARRSDIDGDVQESAKNAMEYLKTLNPYGAPGGQKEKTT